MPVPPSAVTISAVFSIVSGRRALTWLDTFGRARLLRPGQYTMAPASPNIRAIPRPAPRVAPTTTATRPLNGLDMDPPLVWLTERELSRSPGSRLVPVLRIAADMPGTKRGADRAWRECRPQRELAHEAKQVLGGIPNRTLINPSITSLRL